MNTDETPIEEEKKSRPRSRSVPLQSVFIGVHLWLPCSLTARDSMRAMLQAVNY